MSVPLNCSQSQFTNMTTICIWKEGSVSCDELPTTLYPKKLLVTLHNTRVSFRTFPDLEPSMALRFPTHLVLESEVCGGWHVQAGGQDDELDGEDTELALLGLAGIALHR